MSKTKANPNSVGTTDVIAGATMPECRLVPESETGPAIVVRLNGPGGMWVQAPGEHLEFNLCYGVPEAAQSAEPTQPPPDVELQYIAAALQQGGRHGTDPGTQALWDTLAALREAGRELTRLEEAAATKSGLDLNAASRQVADKRAQMGALDAQASAIEMHGAAGMPTTRPVTETPKERRERVAARAQAMGGTKVRGVVAKLAKEEGVSPARIKQLLANDKRRRNEDLA